LINWDKLARRFHCATVRELLESVYQGRSLREAARELGVSAYALRQALLRHDISPRPRGAPLGNKNRATRWEDYGVLREALPAHEIREELLRLYGKAPSAATIARKISRTRGSRRRRQRRS